VLLMIDIDHFKLLSDRYGHVRDDACLRACVPACLRAVGETLSPVTLEKAVVVARYGGEELAFLLPGSMSGARPRSPKRRAGPSKTFS
jgi:diguanylate cyclase (GGDEF)-like protein